MFFCKNLIISLMPLAFLSQSSPVQEIHGRVVSVADGDTITVLDSAKQYKIRLNGIDCPEKSQAFGRRSKEFTQAKAFSKEVRVILLGRDRYQRYLGEVILPDGKSLNKLLLKNGYAWWYRAYSKDSENEIAELEAREKKLGLWQDENPLSPWDFRKLKKLNLK